MPIRSSDHVETIKQRTTPSNQTTAGSRDARPLELARYLRWRSDELAVLWSSEISARELGQGTEFDKVVGQFMAQLTDILPWLLGPQSSHVQPMWDRTAELFGVMAAKRGLAAGEVMEEFQILRELLIRRLFNDPLPEGPLSLRDTLRLHRIVDRGVTHAGVGHTDAMFFQFLESEEPRVMKTPEEIVREAEIQLALVAEDLAQIVEVTPVAARGVKEH